MPRLRRADCSAPGIRRIKRGKGFNYTWELTGERVTDPEVLQRIHDLVLPPAWQDVWICPWPNGHLQAVGTDAAGRKQYRYHDDWRTRRDAEKFDEMLTFARALPRLREIIDEQLETEGLTRERVLACAVRLLDRGFFRIGVEIGRSGELETFGLTTMRKEHVTVGADGLLTFEYDGKGGKHRVQSVVDHQVCEIVAALKRRRGGGQELLAYRGDTGQWVDVTARDVNEWIKQQTCGAFSAKDFRTWNATVLAAIALATSAAVAKSKTARKRAEARVAKEVAHYLGNTPTVARSSYIDPRVFDRYRSGWTISGVLTSLGDEAEFGEPSIHGTVEEAVVDLLENRTSSDAVERVAALAS